MNAYIKIRAALEWGEGPIFVEALAALAELERAAAQPVAYQYAHPYFGGGKIWREEQRWNGHTSDEARALYAALPAPVAEIREPVEVDDEIARKLWREWFDAGCMTGLDTARFWLRVWQRELGPTLGMVPPDARADARIAELERECSQWRDELRIYRESEDARIAELESRLSKLLHAAENVRRWDWSDNDEDCVDDILKLGDAIDAARANGGEP